MVINEMTIDESSFEVNTNSKTQPLCVTVSQQFCRPTPLDLTIFVANKRAREQAQRVLQSADAVYGGVKMASQLSIHINKQLKQ